MTSQSRAERRVLLLSATTAYQTGDFVAAAERLGVDVAIGSDRCHVLAETWPQGAIPLDFRDPDRAADQIAAAARSQPLAGIVATDEVTSAIAARAAALLDLPCNPVDAVDAAGNKLAFRRALSAAGLPQPAFAELSLANPVVPDLEFPVVIKPLSLSASRGVMRADSVAQLNQRIERLAALLSRPDIRSDRAIVETFVAGDELAFEGLLAGGRLRQLALFDKPEPLDGPFFAETIYVTPPVRSPAETRAVFEAVEAAAGALGLTEGPVHAEVRLGPAGPVVLELAARSIGGLCGRALSFGVGISLEEVVIAHAVGDDVRPVRESVASGVLMLPVPRTGVLESVEGVDRARAVEHVGDVVITAPVGELVEPLPEGHIYLGFAFARADTPELVTAALRSAGELLVPVIKPRIGPMS